MLRIARYFYLLLLLKISILVVCGKTVENCNTFITIRNHTGVLFLSVVFSGCLQADFLWLAVAIADISGFTP